MGLDQTQTVIALCAGLSFGLIAGLMLGSFGYVVRNMVAGVLGAYMGLWMLPKFAPALGVYAPFAGTVTEASILAIGAIILLRISDW
jgi:uncharacterized membrane protein YeaQ/YmgE (transglycosylase-associated protein family)